MGVWRGDVFPQVTMRPSRVLRMLASPVGRRFYPVFREPARLQCWPATSGPPSRRHQIRPVPPQLALQVSGRLASVSSAGPPTRACQLRPRPPASQQVASPPVGLRPTVRRAIHHAADGQPEYGFMADTARFSGKALHPSTGPAVSETDTRPNPRDLLSQWVTSGPIKGIAFIVAINRHFKLHFGYTNSDSSLFRTAKIHFDITELYSTCTNFEASCCMLWCVLADDSFQPTALEAPHVKLAWMEKYADDSYAWRIFDGWTRVIFETAASRSWNAGTGKSKVKYH